MARDETLTTRLVTKIDDKRVLDDYVDTLDGLDDETITTVLALKAGQVKTDLEDLLVDIAKLDETDPTITPKLEKAAELKAELDGLEAQITDINSTPVDIDSKPATDGVKNLGTEADNSRSVMANMVGNTTQDLGQLGGVAGSAGVAIGQLGEYAADGNISLQGLANMAGPMLVLAAAAAVVSEVLGDIAATKAFHKEQVEKWVDALRDGKTVVQAISDDIKETSKIEFISSGDVKDATGSLDRLKLSADDFIKAVDDPALLNSWKDQRDEIDKTVDSLLKTKTEMQGAFGPERQAELDEQKSRLKDYNSVIDAVEQKVRDTGAATDEASQMNRVYGDSAEETARKLEEQKQAAEDAADAATASIDAYRAAADANFALRDAQRDLNDTLNELPKKLEDAGGDLTKIQSAYDDVALSAGKVADETVRVADEQAKADGTTLSQRDKLDLWNSKMLEAASTLKGPARDAILGYIGDVNGIPPEKISEISADLDEGSVDKAATALNDASKARTAAVDADANTATAENDLNETARERKARITAEVVPTGNWWNKVVQSQMGGGGVKPNAAPAGVGRAAEPAAGDTLSPIWSNPDRQTTARPNATTIIVNVPRGYRELDAATASHRVALRSGRLYARR